MLGVGKDVIRQTESRAKVSRALGFDAFTNGIGWVGWADRALELPEVGKAIGQLRRKIAQRLPLRIRSWRTRQNVWAGKIGHKPHATQKGIAGKIFVAYPSRIRVELFSFDAE